MAVETYTGRDDLRASFPREVVAGITVALVTVPICVASGVLAHAPIGSGQAARGALAGLFCAVAGGLVSAFVRRSSPIVVTPTTPSALVQASFAAAFLPAVKGDAGLGEMGMALCVLAAGLCQIAFALLGAGRIIKFIPHPVLAGFASGIALLLIVPQLSSLLGVEVWHSGQLDRPAMTALGLGDLLAMFLVGRYAPRTPAPLAGLVIGFVLFHGTQVLAPGVDLGPVIGAVRLDALPLPAWTDLALLGPIMSNGEAVQVLLANAFTLAALGTLDGLIAGRAARNAVDAPMHPRRDLVAQGAANVAASLVGATIVSTSLSLLSANVKAGGRFRMSVVVACVGLFVGTALFPSLIGEIPRVALSAVLVYLGVKLFDCWCFAVVREGFARETPAHARRARRDTLVLLTVLGATSLNHPATGAAVGVLLCGAIFIADMSRPVVRNVWRGSELKSKRFRSAKESAFLQDWGAGLAIYKLQGVLFFGNADDLANLMRDAERGTHTFVLDFEEVTDIDASGAHALSCAASRCAMVGKRLILAHGSDPNLSRIAADAHPDLDAALEAVEDAALRSRGEGSGGGAFLVGQLEIADGLSETQVEVLASHLVTKSYPAAAELCREGDPPDAIWLLGKGSVSVRIRSGRSSRRIAGLGQGAMVGEMSVLEGRPRSATIVADEEVETFVLSAEALNRLLTQDPGIGQVLLANIARETARRLRATSDALRIARS